MPVPGAVEVLDALADRYALVGVLSGRPVEFLQSILPAPADARRAVRPRDRGRRRAPGPPARRCVARSGRRHRVTLGGPWARGHAGRVEGDLADPALPGSPRACRRRAGLGGAAGGPVRPRPALGQDVVRAAPADRGRQGLGPARPDRPRTRRRAGADAAGRVLPGRRRRRPPRPSTASTSSPPSVSRRFASAFAAPRAIPRCSSGPTSWSTARPAPWPCSSPSSTPERGGLARPQEAWVGRYRTGSAPHLLLRTVLAWVPSGKFLIFQEFLLQSNSRSSTVVGMSSSDRRRARQVRLAEVEALVGRVVRSGRSGLSHG